MNKLIHIFCLIVFGLGAIFWTGGKAQAEARQEYFVKAAFVYNFIKFTEWKGNSATVDDGIFDLFVVGEQAIEDAFLSLDGKKVGAHVIRVHFKRTTDSFEDSDVVFVSRTIMRSGLLRVLTAVKGRPILTVGEMSDFTRLGGVINLVSSDKGGVHFEVNRDAASRQQVVISSHILRLATLVED
ncbi:MAG: YfiR family protein [Desulfobulbaceae bacterium]|uniref:YfiR family protein n=1 Tax=Candidatus Desulfatifera sulfidica TaxID=2841691 RepID=A0A8J6N8X1_9BACT|nr:YfiR family protein [Candidatus Desulfatifera sulfidica]